MQTGTQELSWLDVYEDDALWDGEKISVTVAGKKVLLMRVAGVVVAFNDACPHKGTPLSEGALEDGKLVCRVHLWEFDARSGTSINPVGRPLACIPVRQEAGRILVGLPCAT